MSMFANFDPEILNSVDFKEDAVREAIISPMLRRLGFHASGDNRIAYSKPLKHPFLRVGTQKIPITLIPDYTLFCGTRPVFVLDAKSPHEDILNPEHIQQVFSYAVHPDLKCREFGLCNGRHLVVFNVDKSEPTLRVPFSEFESRWLEIEKFLSPSFLKKPFLRNYSPDFGFKLRGIGYTKESVITMFGVRLNGFGKVDNQTYTATANCDFAGQLHCVSYDFPASMLHEMTAGLPKPLQNMFIGALERAPFKAIAGLAIEIDLQIQLGDETKGMDDVFIPLRVIKVVDARFNPTDPGPDSNEYPPEIFQLRQAFKIKN